MERQAYQDRFKKEDSQWWFLARRAAIASYLAGAGKKHDILDIGAGTAGTSQYLKLYGDVTAVENNQVALLFAGQRAVRVTAGDAEALPSHSEAYDIVFMLDTLAHRGISNEKRALAEAYRTLRPGGHLIVTAPAYKSLWSPHDDIQHFSRRYTRHQLVQLLESSGFKVDRATYLYWLITPFSFIWRGFERLFYTDRMDLGATPKWIELLLLKLHLFEAKLLGFFELPWGSSILVRAIKPAPPTGGPRRDPPGSHPLRST